MASIIECPLPVRNALPRILQFGHIPGGRLAFIRQRRYNSQSALARQENRGQPVLPVGSAFLFGFRSRLSFSGSVHLPAGQSPTLLPFGTGEMLTAKAGRTRPAVLQVKHPGQGLLLPGAPLATAIVWQKSPATFLCVWPSSFPGGWQSVALSLPLSCCGFLLSAPVCIARAGV